MYRNTEENPQGKLIQQLQQAIATATDEASIL